MFRNKLWLHQIVLFGFLGILVVWSVFRNTFSFDINFLWWLLGSMIGFLFVFCDRLVYALSSGSDETLGMRVRDLFTQGRMVEGLKTLLTERYDQRELVMRSFIFAVIWIFLAIFTVSSVTNYFAKGFVLGIGIHLVFDLIFDFFTDKERLDSWFWQIKRTLEPSEKQWFVAVVTLVFLLLAFNL